MANSIFIGFGINEYLVQIGNLTPADNTIIVGNGTAWVAESGATARTSLGLGTGDSPTFTRVRSGDGTEALPAFGPSADTATGLYFTANRILFSTAATLRAFVDAGGFYMNGPLILSATTQDVRLARLAARTLSLGPTTGVTLRWATDGTLEVRNFANSAAANLTALQVTTATAASAIATSVALTDGAGAGAGTITNAPAAGNPTKWIGINDNGTVRYVPAW